LVVIFYVTFIDISRRGNCGGAECSKNIKNGICIGNMVICMIVLIISTVYETQYNKTNPKIISYFFIACWCFIVLSLLTLPGIYGNHKWTCLQDILIGINLFVSSLFIIWWICCQIIGIIIEIYWSLNFFTCFITVLVVIYFTIITFRQKKEAMEDYIKHNRPSLNFQVLENKHWFLRWKNIILFIIILVVILILELYVLSLCFSFIQHSSLTMSLIQSVVNFITGGVTVAITRSNTVTGFDSDNKMAEKLIDSISELQETSQKNEERIQNKSDLKPKESTPLLNLSESGDRNKKQEKP